MDTLKSRALGLGAALALGALVACAAPDAAAPQGSEVESESEAQTVDTAFHGNGHDNGNACTSIAPAPHFRDWPRIRSAIRSDERDEAFIQRVVKAMTLEQKVGQMTQGEIGSLWNATTASYDLTDVTRLGLGSILNGGGSWPEFNKHAAVSDWMSLADAIWDASPTVTVPGRHGSTQIKI